MTASRAEGGDGTQQRLLEQVWQTVSNEYFDQYGRFTQAEWAGELFRALDLAGGLLHSKAETQLGERTHIDWARWASGPGSSFAVWAESSYVDTEFMAMDSGIRRGISAGMVELDAGIPEDWQQVLTGRRDMPLHVGWWAYFDPASRPLIARYGSLIYGVADVQLLGVHRRIVFQGSVPLSQHPDLYWQPIRIVGSLGKRCTVSVSYRGGYVLETVDLGGQPTVADSLGSRRVVLAFTAATRRGGALIAFAAFLMWTGWAAGCTGRQLVATVGQLVALALTKQPPAAASHQRGAASQRAGGVKVRVGLEDQSCWYLPLTWRHSPSVVMWSIRDAAAIFGTQEDCSGDGQWHLQRIFSTLGMTISRADTVLGCLGLWYKAVKGMVSRLQDRYSSFLTPEEYRFALHRPIQSELKYLAYQYTGVGMEIGKRHSKGGFEIVAPFAGSPAEEAGILGGERLLSVDGLSVDLLTVDEAVTLLRGPIGSLVELEVKDAKPYAGFRKIILERRALPLPPVRMEMINAENGRLVAYIRLHYFTHDGTKKMASAIREGEALGVDGYILDLRNNPGGVFEESIAMAALWLDCTHCGISETVRSNATDVDDFTYVAGSLPESIFHRHPGVLTHAPLVTISNRNSASASEVLIGALQDNGRTLVFGEKTFGKGVVQYYFPMDDGSGLKLTVAKYLTPKRYDISKQTALELVTKERDSNAKENENLLRDLIDLQSQLTRKEAQNHELIKNEKKMKEQLKYEDARFQKLNDSYNTIKNTLTALLQNQEPAATTPST
ncbi:hypothetical protein L7F22_028710 [Adiantum nelumboides]|nr:hypothetical protein [Adiantum nelumboides]